MKKFLFVVALGVFCLQTTFALADLLVPAELMAKKSKDPAKESVYSWTNSDKYRCDAPVIFFFDQNQAKELCDLCPNRKLKKRLIKETWNDFDLYGKNYDNYDISMRKNPNGSWSSRDVPFYVYVCAPDKIKECPKDKPLLDNLGVCHACDEEAQIDISWAIGEKKSATSELYKLCSVCNNRKVIESRIETEDTTEDNYLCVLSECPKERPLQDYYGVCHNCDDPDAILLNIWRCNWVENSVFNNNPWRGKENEACPNRIETQGGSHTCFKHTILKDCPSDKPLRDENGGCRSCDEVDDIPLHKSVGFWGATRDGNIYDENLNLVGTVDEGRFDMEEEALSDKTRWKQNYTLDLYKLERDKKRGGNEKIGYMKVRFTGGVCDGQKCENYTVGDFEASIYGPDDKLIAMGGGIQYGAERKHRFNADYYYTNVHPDKVCPNREVFREEFFSGYKSRLKK